MFACAGLAGCSSATHPYPEASDANGAEAALLDASMDATNGLSEAAPVDSTLDATDALPELGPVDATLDATDALPELGPVDATLDATDASDAPNDTSGCSPPLVLRYETAGCGAEAHPVCGGEPEDACAILVCACSGHTVVKCDYATEPWGSVGACDGDLGD